MHTNGPGLMGRVAGQPATLAAEGFRQSSFERHLGTPVDAAYLIVEPRGSLLSDLLNVLAHPFVDIWLSYADGSSLLFWEISGEFGSQ